MNSPDPEEHKRLSQRTVTRSPLNIEFPKMSPIYFVLIALTLLLLLWAFLGRIPKEISGTGVAMSQSGTSVITASAPGKVSAIYVKAGDTVEAGTPLGVIYNPEIKALLVKIDTSRFKIYQQESELKLLKSTYETNRQLFHEGLISKLVLDDSKTKIYEKEIAIQESEATRDAQISDLSTIASASKKIVTRIQDELLRHPENLDLDSLANELSTFEAPTRGKVLEVLISEGDRVDRKEALFWIESPVENRGGEIFYSTVSTDVIGHINVGMRALIEPLIVNPQEYGSIIGRVKTVYPYPVSKDELVQTLGNQQIVEFMIGKVPAKTLLIVEPQLNLNNPSGFEWTSAQGPPYTIPSGTICNLKIVIDEQPPISYLIPLWKIKKPFESRVEPKEP